MQRTERSSKQADFLQLQFPRLSEHFATGDEVDAEKVKPRLERVRSGTWQADLFKLASLTWSVPVSPGFGRRLRYLVWDSSNQRLMGILAIGDPVFNLRSRDDYIGWTGEQRRSRLVHIMDAYVLGAVPPYNRLLGRQDRCLVVAYAGDFRRLHGHLWCPQRDHLWKGQTSPAGSDHHDVINGPVVGL